MGVHIISAIPESVLTTRGDTIFRNATKAARLAKGTDGQFLKIGADDPIWADVAGIPESVLTTQDDMIVRGASIAERLAVAASRIIGKKATGNVGALTAAEILTIIGVEAGADVTGSNAPQAHKVSHQDTGGDELSVVGLSGLLADDQHVLDAEVIAVAIAISLLTTRGDIIFRNATVPARLAKGTSGYVLTMGADDPAWSSPDAASVSAVEAAGLTFAENKGIILDAVLSADGKYSGTVEAGTAGTTLAFGDLVYLAVADSRWELTDADLESTAFGKIGICVLAAADTAATLILLWGKVRADAVFPALTIGAPVHVGVTAGDIQVAAPVGVGDIVRIIGYGNTADELFFCPDNTYVEIA